MPIRTPETVRRALGDEAVVDLLPWVEEIIAEKAVPRDEYRQVLSRLDILERDVADAKAGLSDVRAGVRDLRREMNECFDRLHVRFDQMYDRMLVQTRWMVATIAVFGMLITALLAIGQFSP